MIPIRSDAPVRQTPLANYAIILLNIFVFLVGDMMLKETFFSWKNSILGLNAGLPEWWQFFTYQFMHGGIAHLAGNMLFLWVFGNSVNARLGNWPYLLFYLSGGVFAGWGFATVSDQMLIGASGAVAAVTTAFMVLFPRSRILFLFWFILITTFELPGLWVILFKVVLWDNVLAPALSPGGNVAYSAHLYGYSYGFAATLGMLMFGALSRDQFDLLGLVKRWNKRRAYATMISDPNRAAKARYGTVARPVTLDSGKRREAQARLDRVSELRGRIAQILMSETGHEAALDEYEQLMIIDQDQCLPRQQQLSIARLLYSTGKFPQAAGAFENFARHYPTAAEKYEVHLLLGIIYARDLIQHEAAEGHLNLALEGLRDESRRAQAREWLDHVTGVLHSAKDVRGT